ncbi:hypothetical protein [Chryseobacterium luteum]|nr:hypothetical protein [Chryseobacterium luteum]
MADTSLGKYDLLIRQGADKYLAELDKLHWFEQTNLKREEVVEYLNEHKKLPILCIYSIAENLWHDSEGYDDMERYLELTKDYLKLANIQIKTIHGFDNGEIDLATSSNSYHYTIKDFEPSNDWIEDGFIDNFINQQILTKENCNKRFYIIPPMDQSIFVLFLTPELHQQAIDKGIIPDNPNYYDDKEQLFHDANEK